MKRLRFHHSLVCSSPRLTMGNEGPRDECFDILARSSGDERDERDEPIRYNIKQEMR